MVTLERNAGIANYKTERTLPKRITLSAISKAAGLVSDQFLEDVSPVIQEPSSVLKMITLTAALSRVMMFS